MRWIASAYVLTGGAVLFWATSGTDGRFLGGLALVLSALWLLNAARARTGTTAMFTGFVAIAAASSASGAGPLLPAISVTLALLGWDASLAALRLRRVPRKDCHRIVARYAASSGAVGVAAFGLILATTFLHFHPSFGLAVGLAVALLALAVIIGSLARPTPAAAIPVAPTEPEEPASTDRKAGQLSLPGPNGSESS